MSGCCDPRGYRRLFSGDQARRNANAYRKKGLDGTARELVERLCADGVDGSTVLDVGGGVGGIGLELLRAGAGHVTNVELSPEYEEEARALAAEAGVSERVDRVVGDFAVLAPSLEPADVVVMHRVVCCYPFLGRMLRPAADRAKRSLALTYPRSNLLIRGALRLGNVWFWLTRCSFRVFVHPPDEMARIAADHGLRETFRRRGWLWESVVYERVMA